MGALKWLVFDRQRILLTAPTGLVIIRALGPRWLQRDTSGPTLGEKIDELVEETLEASLGLSARHEDAAGGSDDAGSGRQTSRSFSQRTAL